MRRWLKNSFSFLLLGLGILPGQGLRSHETTSPLMLIRSFHAVEDFPHVIGRKGGGGWTVDHRNDPGGYVLEKPRAPLTLGSGLFRASFYLRRGTYPKKVFLNDALAVFRLEIWDATTGEIIAQREVQRCELSQETHPEPRWIEFSMRGRENHVVEPRLYWLGMANAEIEKIEIHRFPPYDPAELERKALRIGASLKRDFLENGFVVSRQDDGTPDELGDAATYTAYYAASLAWRTIATQSHYALQELENALNTLHSIIRGPLETPFLTRYVDADNNPFPKPPSKDVYNSFFLAYSVAYPVLKNESLKRQMREDISRLAERLIADELKIRAGGSVCVSLTPYFTDEELRTGIRKLLSNERHKQNFLNNLKIAKRLVPFSEPWTGLKKTIQAVKNNDEDELYDLVVPNMNGLAQMAGRVAEILREQYRMNMFFSKSNGKDLPGKRLERLISAALKKFPEPRDGDYFRSSSDLKILASNSLLALSLVKTAAVMTGEYQFDDFYGKNLYSGHGLLQCALDWTGKDDQFIQATAGNSAFATMREGINSLLALSNLLRLEENPFIREKYVDILRQDWNLNQHEDNPLIHAIIMAEQKNRFLSSPDFILRALHEYPEDRKGLGPGYWAKHGKALAHQFGGGEIDGLSREPLPISLRPRDSFLWQRNARRLKGDNIRRYPGTDYLFVYWYARAHRLIPASFPTPLAEQ